MLRDITESFKKTVKADKNVILDNYVLKEGLYFKLNINESFDQVNESRCLVINKNEDVIVEKIELEKWFKERDYLSSVLNDDMNKAIDLPAKKIHSTNYMTIFIKKEVFPEIGKQGKTITKSELKNRLSGFFDAFMVSEKKLEEMLPENNLRGKAKILAKEEFLNKYFRDTINYLRSEERREKINQCKQYILQNLDKFIEFMEQFNENNKFDNYIKIFFQEPIEKYKIENRAYIIPRIFNVNKYNLVENDKILGLPSSDITTNSKKPYLLPRTMKCTVPYRDAIDNVEITKNFYNWLGKKSKEEKQEIKLQYDYEFNSNLSYDKEKPFYSIHMDKSNHIDDFDNIPVAEPNIDLIIENVLKVQKWDKENKKYSKVQLEENIPVKSLNQLQKLVSKYYFNNNMRGYFKNYEPDIVKNKFTGTLKVLFLKSRDAFFDYFHKGINTNIKEMIDEITISSIEEQIRKTVEGNKLNKIRQAYNIRLSLLKYFKVKGGSMMSYRIEELVEKVKDKIRSHKVQYCESDEEFYFLAGQLSYYIMSQSEASNKTFGLFEPFLSAKNSRQLKRKLADVFEIYKHAISINNVKFKNAMAMVMGYETDAKIKDEMKDMLLAGLLSNNMFYEKNKEEVEINEK